MTLQIADRVKETTTTTGTGPLTLAGAMTGYRAFSAVCTTGDTCNYALHAVDANGVPTGDWEVGQGTYSAANTLTRTTILASSNAGAAVNLAAGTKQAWIDYPAAAINSGPLAGLRNKVIGGDFSTNPWQRGTTSFGGISSASGSVYSADRFLYATNSTAVVNISKNPFAPSVAQAGRLTTDCLQIAVTTIDTTVDPGDISNVVQYIEGYNWASLAQRPCILSFWHAHTKTGIYCVNLRNTGGDRSFVAEYTQTVSNAWELATIVIPPSPSAGTWNYTNGAGVGLGFSFAVGTNFQTTPGIWQTGQFFGTANQVNGMDSTANAFRFDLIQIEPGVIATPFEDVPVGTVLQLCQRYFCKSFTQGTAPAGAAGFNLGEANSTPTQPGAANFIFPRIFFPVTMRGNPTVTTFNPVAANAQVRNNTLPGDCTGTSASNNTDSGFLISCVLPAGTILGSDLRVHWTASAEL